jgi:ketosteroid isomerase-like protein
METRTSSVPSPTLQRVQAAQNQHDLEAFLACFDPDFVSEQPAHPDRAFRGREQVRKNWSAIFNSTPDFQSEILRAINAGGIEWAEWRWYGTRVDGTQLDLRCVTIFGIQDDRITWGRLYIEPLEEKGAGIDQAVKSYTQGSQQGS